MNIFVNHNSWLLFHDEDECNRSLDEDFIDCWSTYWGQTEKCEIFDDLAKEMISFYDGGIVYKELKNEVIKRYDSFTEKYFEEVDEQEAGRLMLKEGYEWGD